VFQITAGMAYELVSCFFQLYIVRVPGDVRLQESTPIAKGPSIVELAVLREDSDLLTSFL